MQVTVDIEDHYKSKIYNSGSVITGSVSISSETNIAIKSIRIKLVGTAYTRVEMLPTTKITKSVFLNLDMPLHEASYPTERMLKADKTHCVVFKFILPRQLPRDACNKSTGHGQIQQLHMRLPPTVGNWERDDLSPSMATVVYEIVAQVAPERDANSPGTTEARIPLKVLPDFPEDPPLQITDRDGRYAMTKTKFIRRSWLQSKRDWIAITATQPNSLRLSCGGNQALDNEPSALIDILVSCALTSAAPEVEIEHLAIEAFTWFSGVPMHTLPELGEPRDASGTRHELKFSTAIKLPLTALGDVKWEAGGHDTGRQTWKATVRIPIRLPTTQKMFLPTFYSCFVARTYALHVPVCVSGVKFHLTLPLQVTVEPSTSNLRGMASPELPTFDAALSWG
ncbi:hypothetical protein CTRI78_v007075 [Colletotrichum trifolii]|uniref:Arrestin-like N-terminal domain-containing protein n=1 Tax=Colletotrichum trifolii TaxID=5466 RepID=A0A4R8RA52_COLTR|nr:hypothetical protein CTRI78_v007075 [Colletotrichum trifolii]